MLRDFADSIKAPVLTQKHIRLRTDRLALPLACVAVACLVLVWALFAGGHTVAASAMTATHEEWIDAQIAAPPAAPSSRRRQRVKRGDTAIAVLSRLAFPSAEIRAMIDAARHVYPLRRVIAGKHISRLDHGRQTDVYYPVDESRMLHLSRHQGTWEASLMPRLASARTTVFQGEVRENLFAAAARAGMDERTTMNLVDIFAWDIDFVRDLRPGDRFRALVEERFGQQGALLDRVILAAEFINQGHTYRAVRYRLANGRVEYFTPAGKSMRKTYLKAPVKFTRISSRFTLRRRHPVLGYTRAHRGVDYAAPTGTPIHAVGDGRVAYAGWKGGYGRFVLIRHTNGNHVTAYAHMRHIARGIRRGVHVRQGQIIGYVGMSGLATGPHLHFEFRVRGRAINPLSVRRTPSRPVPAVQMARFRELADGMLERIIQSPTLLAWD